MTNEELAGVEELVACLEAMTEFAEGVIRIKRLTDTNGIVAASRAALARAKENSNAVIQAYGDARADAARREALEEAAKVARDYASKAAQRGWVLKPGSIVTAARHIATTIRALKGNSRGTD